MTLRRSNRRVQATTYKDPHDDDDSLSSPPRTKRNAPASPDSSSCATPVVKKAKNKRVKKPNKAASKKKKRMLEEHDSDTADESIVAETPSPTVNNKSTSTSLSMLDPETALGSDWRVSSVMDY